MPIMIALYILWGVVYRNTFPVPPPLPAPKNTDYQD
jgi:hypothetical protein